MIEWKDVQLQKADIQLIDGDRGTNYPNTDDFYESGYCLFLNAKNVTKNGFKFDECMFIDENKDKSLGGGKLNRNDIIITTRGTVGNIAYYDKSIKQDSIRINSGMAILRNLNTGLDHVYLKHFLLSNIFLKQMDRVVFGSAQPQLTIKTINNFILHFPTSLPEQRKIARILSTVDTIIEKTESAIAKYKAIKSGMMRDLFTRGIDVKTGKLRPRYEEEPGLYKESELGWVPREWEVARIGESCINFINGGTPSTKNLDNWKGTIPWVTGADFLDSFEIGLIRRYITQDAVSNSSTHVISGGNILLVTRTGVGKLAIAPFDIAISQDITGLILNKEMFTVNYFFVYLQLLVEGFKKMNQGTSINGIVRNDLENTLIIHPGIDEQEKVARRVFAIDRIIADEIDELNKYQQIKTALMSDLLTGKVRVKYNENEKMEAM